MNNEPTFSDGVSAERSRCEMICEAWQTPAYIAVRYGLIDEAALKVLLKAVKLMEEDIASGRLPNRS